MLKFYPICSVCPENIEISCPIGTRTACCFCYKCMARCFVRKGSDKAVGRNIVGRKGSSTGAEVEKLRMNAFGGEGYIILFMETAKG